jgi:predicted metal-dependent hydrolase
MIMVAGAAAHLRRRVIDFLKREARRDLEPRVLHYARALGVAVTAIRLRDQTSRWGSCTVTGHLSFSWRLIMAPPFVLDYLAAHEVSHLIEMNHSRRFWRLCEWLCPQTRQARAWLNAEGAKLHAVGSDQLPVTR